VSCEKTAEPIDLPFGHISATWTIRLNRLSAAAMLPYVNYFNQLLLLWLGRIAVRRCGLLLQTKWRGLSVGLSRSWALQKSLRCGLGVVRWGYTLAPPGEYNWPVHVWRRCGRFVELLVIISRLLL